MPQAFLFDMDGTLVDNMHYHLEAWKKIAADAGSKKDEKAIYSSVYGKNTEILARILDDQNRSEEELKAMVVKKDALYRELYRPHLKLIDGVAEFLEDALQSGIKMAIASGSTPENIDLVLDGLNIRKYFGAIIGGAQVKKSKPDPSTFIQAAEKLGVLSEDCIVFEDVPQGVEAALNGNMKAVAILTTHPRESFERYPNLIEVINDYRVVSVGDLLYLSKAS
jgi:beta-phosphoglucomutase